MDPTLAPEVTSSIDQALHGAMVEEVAVAVLIAGGGVLAGRKLGKFVQAKLSMRMDHASLPKLASRGIQLLLGGASILTSLAQLGVDLSVFLALAGSLWISVGLALQSNLSHIASGLMLQIISPMRPGDRIELDAKQGEVVEIGLFATILRLDSGATLRVPNGELTGKPLVVHRREPSEDGAPTMSVSMVCNTLGQVEAQLSGLFARLRKA